MKTRYIRAISTLFILSILIIGCSDDNKVNNPLPAQSNSFKVTVQSVGEVYKFSSSGIFNTPAGMSSPGPLLPGGYYEFSFSAAPGSRLSFATMFVQSNDLFYAPGEPGISLFDENGSPVSGDITSQMSLWDSGTEMNQEPGLGSDQAPRQTAGNTGSLDADNIVRLAADDFNNLPAVSDVIRVTLSNSSQTSFTLKIENISDGNTLSTSDGGSTAIPLAPGVWVVHSSDSPLFTSGQADTGFGLEGLAEDGDISALSNYISQNTGLVTPFAPGVFAVHTSNGVLFTDGQSDYGEGLETLAEDGDPSQLSSSLEGKDGVGSHGVFNTPAASAVPAPIFPGESYEFTFEASPGDKLSFATMLVQSNDLFAGTSQDGVDLYDANDNAVNGEITSMLYLWDAGTEINEEPGIGLNQAPRQSSANTGAEENGTVRMVADGFNYPALTSLLKITVDLQ